MSEYWGDGYDSDAPDFSLDTGGGTTSPASSAWNPIQQITQVINKTVVSVSVPVDKINSYVDSKVNWALNKAQEKLNLLKNLVNHSTGKVKEALGWIAGGVENALSSAMSAASGAIQVAGNRIAGTANSAIGAMKSLTNGAIARIGDAASGAIGAAGKTLSIIGSKIGDLAQTAISKTGGALEKAGAWLSSLASKAIDYVKDGANSLWNYTKETYRSISSKVMSLLKKIHGYWWRFALNAERWIGEFFDDIPGNFLEGLRENAPAVVQAMGVIPESIGGH